MKIYHGTISIFDKIRLVNSPGTKDFGCGFYTTNDVNHAKSIAVRLHRKSMVSGIESHMFIYSYNINKQDMREQLEVKEFLKGTADWLDLLAAFRAGSIPINADVIIGPTADNAATAILNQLCFPNFDSVSNKLNLTKEQKEDVINRLKPHIFGTQYCFKTKKSLRWLSKFFIEMREIR